MSWDVLAYFYPRPAPLAGENWAAVPSAGVSSLRCLRGEFEPVQVKKSCRGAFLYIPRRLRWDLC